MNINIEFPLPFKIPVIDGAKVVSAYSIADFRLVIKQQKNQYIFVGENEKNVYEYTIITVDYYSPNNDLKNEKDIKRIFHFAVVNSIEYINHFIDAVRVIHNLRTLRNFTIIDLPETINIEYDGVQFLYATNPVGVIVDEKEVKKEGVSKVLKLLSTWDKYPEIEVVDKFFDKAKYYLAKEQFIFSIIELQTSFEVFIRNSYRLILLKNGAADEVIEKAASFAFRNVIEQHLAKVLNTQLSFTEDGPIKDWHDNLYIIRNQIVHSGKAFINGNQAYKAYDVYVEARNYIADLLVKEGYLSESGMVDLNTFVKNTRDDIDYDIIHKRLIEKGFIPSDLPIIKE